MDAAPTTLSLRLNAWSDSLAIESDHSTHEPIDESVNNFRYREDVVGGGISQRLPRQRIASTEDFHFDVLCCSSGYDLFDLWVSIVR